MSPKKNIVDPRTSTSYEVLKRLGKGAFATCYLVTSRQRSHPHVQSFALKRFPRRAAEDERSFEKICNEVEVHGRLCSGVRHPNLVSMFSAFDSEDGDICMLLEYCSNGNLSDFVEHMEGSALSEPDAIRFLKQLLNAVDYMHTVHDVIHRDIKPGNVLLSNNYTVKLADFGLATTVDECKRRLSVCGTPNFVSPEIIQYRGHTFASDYWALTCTFYYMLSGITPFQTNSIRGTYARICRADFTYPDNFTGGPKSKDFIERVLVVDHRQRLNMLEMISHPLFNIVRRSSMGNLLTDSNGNIFEVPLKPLTKCQSMLDFNNNRSSQDSSLVSQAMFCRYLQGLLNQSDSMGFGITLSDDFLPDTYVAKWVDYTNKFGFGTMLRNGVRSIVFNDDSVLSTVDGEQFIYHPNKTKKSCMIWDSYSSPNPSIQSKINTARYVRNYMDQELNTSVPMEEVDEFLSTEACRNAYVMDVLKCENAIVFLISDGSMQINFIKEFRMKVFLQRENDVVHVHTVSTQTGILSFTVEENLRASERIIPPNWVSSVLDTIHEFIQRRSLAGRSTKC